MIVAGLVLAGGKGSRLGAAVPKPLVRLGRETLLERVLSRLPDDVTTRLVSANDSAFGGLGLDLVADSGPGFAGPLAGLDAAAAVLAERCDPATHLLMLPGDTPFLPHDIASRMTALPGDLPRTASFRGRLQPAVTLWPLAALDGLPAFLDAGGKASILRFLEATGYQPIEVPEVGALLAPRGDAFFNVNTPDELEEARRFLQNR